MDKWTPTIREDGHLWYIVASTVKNFKPPVDIPDFQPPIYQGRFTKNWFQLVEGKTYDRPVDLAVYYSLPTTKKVLTRRTTKPLRIVTDQTVHPDVYDEKMRRFRRIMGYDDGPDSLLDAYTARALENERKEDEALNKQHEEQRERYEAERKARIEKELEEDFRDWKKTTQTTKFVRIVTDRTVHPDVYDEKMERFKKIMGYEEDEEERNKDQARDGGDKGDKEKDGTVNDVEEIERNKRDVREEIGRVLKGGEKEFKGVGKEKGKNSERGENQEKKVRERRQVGSRERDNVGEKVNGTIGKIESEIDALETSPGISYNNTNKNNFESKKSNLGGNVEDMVENGTSKHRDHRLVFHVEDLISRNQNLDKSDTNQIRLKPQFDKNRNLNSSRNVIEIDLYKQNESFGTSDRSGMNGKLGIILEIKPENKGLENKTIDNNKTRKYLIDIVIRRNTMHNCNKTDNTSMTTDAIETTTNMTNTTRVNSTIVQNTSTTDTSTFHSVYNTNVNNLATTLNQGSSNVKIQDTRSKLTDNGKIKTHQQQEHERVQALTEQDIDKKDVQTMFQILKIFMKLSKHLKEEKTKSELLRNLVKWYTNEEKQLRYGKNSNDRNEQITDSQINRNVHKPVANIRVENEDNKPQKQAHIIVKRNPQSDKLKGAYEKAHEKDAEDKPCIQNVNRRKFYKFLKMMHINLTKSAKDLEDIARKARAEKEARRNNPENFLKKAKYAKFEAMTLGDHQKVDLDYIDPIFFQDSSDDESEYDSQDKTDNKRKDKDDKTKTKQEEDDQDTKRSDTDRHVDKDLNRASNKERIDSKANYNKGGILDKVNTITEKFSLGNCKKYFMLPLDYDYNRWVRD